jgi:pilus assembly protein Flp/PilA
MFDLIKLHALTSLIAFRTDRRGAAALEYALLVSFIALAIVTGVTSFGTALGTFFSGLATTIGAWA